jgi:hypothetical protein
VFFDPSPPSPLPSKGRGGIEAAFRQDWENFNDIGLMPMATSCRPMRGSIAESTHFSLLTSHFPLPPSHFSLLTSHFSLLTSHVSLLTSHFSLLTSHFSLLTSHFPLPTSHFSLPTSHFSLLTSHLPPDASPAHFARGLPSGGSALPTSHFSLHQARRQHSLPADCRPAAGRGAFQTEFGKFQDGIPPVAVDNDACMK